MYPLVKRYPINTAGRDFVVGDIHGAFTLLLMAMDRVNFNKTVDRLFCVGDLIDRGEESARVVKFLEQPYVHAVRGNHEDMLMALHPDDELPEFTKDHWMVTRNGFGWWLNTPPDQKRAILAAVRKLPIVIEVNTPRGTAGILHAEVTSGLSWQDFLNFIEDGDQKVTETALWGRDRIESKDERVSSVSIVFLSGIRRSGVEPSDLATSTLSTPVLFSQIWEKITPLDLRSWACFGNRCFNLAGWCPAAQRVEPAGDTPFRQLCSCSRRKKSNYGVAK